MLTTLFFVCTQAFAIDFQIQPQEGFVPRDYVESALNAIPFAQARPTGDGRIEVRGPVHLDMRSLPYEIASAMITEVTLLRTGAHPTLGHFDITKAKLSFRWPPNPNPQLFSLTLNGTSGIGKTALARELIEQVQDLPFDREAFELTMRSIRETSRSRLAEALSDLPPALVERMQRPVVFRPRRDACQHVLDRTAHLRTDRE